MGAGLFGLTIVIGFLTVPDGSAPAAAEHVGTPAPLDDSPEAQRARNRVVDRIARVPAVKDERVLEALRQVPRHLFVAVGLDLAYRDRPLPIGYGQTISQPLVVALMTQALDLHGSERVLEIGTGSGYQAAVLARLAAHVDSIEILRPIGEQARSRLAALGYKNVSVHIGDGYGGWPDGAPFDRILLTAAPPELPAALVAQLTEGGIIVAPIGVSPRQRLHRWRKHEGKLLDEDIGPIRFVPMVHGR